LLIPFIKFKFWFKLKVKFCYEFNVGLGINTMKEIDLIIRNSKYYVI